MLRWAPKAALMVRGGILGEGGSELSTRSQLLERTHKGKPSSLPKRGLQLAIVHSVSTQSGLAHVPHHGKRGII